MRFQSKRSIGSSPYNTTVAVHTISFDINCPACFPHNIFMCFYWHSNWTAVIYLNIISWLNFLMETPCVFCEMRTGCLNIVYVKDFRFEKFISSILMRKQISSETEKSHFMPVTLELPRFFVFICVQDPDIIILLCKKICKIWKSFIFIDLAGC
jgi:hypothetical protein